MLTRNESTIAYPDKALEKQFIWKQFSGCLPEIDIVLNHTCFGCQFGVYAVCAGILPDDAVISSFGVGRDISYEKELHQTVPYEIHFLGPTPASITWIEKQKLPNCFIFHPYGLSSMDQFNDLFPPYNPKRTSHLLNIRGRLSPYYSFC